MAVARHNQYPEGDPVPNNTEVLWDDQYSLEKLENGDCYVMESFGEVLYVTHDTLHGLSLDRGGWLYVKVGGGKVVSYFQIQWHVMIFPEHVSVYNDWWDHYGSNPDGSINWDRDVESVKEYHAKKSGEKSGDLNKDNKVDLQDYNLLFSQYGKKETNLVSDLNKDGEVDLQDYNLFFEAYQKEKS